MKLAFYCIGATGPILLLLIWAMTRIEYRIGSRYLAVRLFGMTLRRLPLGEIRTAHKRDPRGAAERWYNTFRTSHRLLTIERSGGVRRYFCITPRHRYVFLAELRKAVGKVNPDSEWARRKADEEQTTFVGTPSGRKEQQVSEGVAVGGAERI